MRESREDGRSQARNSLVERDLADVSTGPDVPASDAPETATSPIANVVRTTPVTRAREVAASASNNQLVFTFLAAALASDFISQLELDISAAASTLDPASLHLTLGDGEAIESERITISEDDQILTITLPEDEVSEGDQVTIDLATTDGSDFEAEHVSFTVTFSEGPAAGGTFGAAVNGVSSGRGLGDEVNVGMKMEGTEEDDILIGGDGDDVLVGGSGNDILEGGGGNDTLIGGAGDDTLSGGTGDDILIGSAGADTLDGGEGADTLTGGAGGDTFILANLDAADLITDFNDAEGDLLDLTALFDLSDADNVDADELAGFIDYDETSGDLFVDTAGGSADVAATGTRVATLANAPTNVTIVVDDGAGNTSSETIA